MSKKKRKRPPVKGKNYQTINKLRVFGFILSILVIITIAGANYYIRVINPNGKSLFGFETEKIEHDDSQSEDSSENDGTSEDGTKTATGVSEDIDKTEKEDSFSPKEYLEEVENKIKENNRQTPEKYDESFKEYEKKLNDMELELKNDELVNDFNDMTDEFNAQSDAFDKEIEESFGDLDFSLGDVE